MLRHKVASEENLIRITPSVNMSSLFPGLLDNNIADDCACARLIYADQGFPAWAGWVSKCQPAPCVTAC